MTTLPPYLGASFHKTDLQVHSLRDHQWTGPYHPTSQRDDFAKALIACCRRKGLGAIAITDHHDLCLWSYVRDAASSELKSDGAPYALEDQVVVFPGVELTLSTPPCQVILLFDPDLPESNLQHIWGALNIVPNPNEHEKTTTTQRLSTDRTIETITAGLAAQRLNPDETNPNLFKFLDGHFILLPNVKPGGHQNLLRHNFQGHYSQAPFCGGYIEKCLYSSLNIGDLNKLEGRDLAWGRKAIGVFQTSDCRAATASPTGAPVDFIQLGDWPTWVKWAKPSTEALRQACLAKQSRILHTEPTFPLLQIVGVRVSDSVFLATVDLGLSPQLNSFIGGRGTGKSSLLEYIRWALCDDPTGTGTDERELPNFEKRRKALIEETLKPKHARVTVFYKRNEVLYAIERNVETKDESCTVTDNNGNKETMRAPQVRQQFPIISYAQKQLSSVGTLPDEIHRLITDPIKDDLERINESIETDILPSLRQQRINQRRLGDLDVQISAAKTANKNRRDQISALQGQLQALTPSQQKTIDEHSSFSELEQWKRRSEDTPSELRKILSDARGKTQSLQDIKPPAQLPNAKEISSLASAANQSRLKTLATLNQLLDEVSEGKWLDAGQQSSLTLLEAAISQHAAEYQACIAESAKNQKQLEEIQSLNKQLSDSEAAQIALESERSSLDAALTEQGDSPMKQFLAALKERGEILEKQCSQIFEQAQHGFRPVLRRLGDARGIRAAIAELIEGRNVKDSEQKISDLGSDTIKAENPASRWQELMAELDILVGNRESATLPSTPILSVAGFTSANIESLRKGLSRDTQEKNRFFNIHDLIEFEFKRGTKPDGTENYVPFISASPGQQATCLLETLLAQDGAPLLIDQPEEDLDNEQIQSVSERIMTTKNLRQLIFVSHNANIVVNGDSELVACFKYHDQNDNTAGLIDPVGSIDCEPVRETITSVMEGGKRAFELRREKYGF
ncbi:MAG: TrlF family AAA-like ATPase [Terracidiphilus sp.]